MTKLWVTSDLHYDFGGLWLQPPSDADIAIIAGDAQDDKWLEHISSLLPTVYVAGNHTFYGWDYQERLQVMRSIPGLHFLENDSVVIKGVTIAGATLWTDYGYSPVAAEVARRGMNDHRYIKWTKEPYQRFLPSHATKLHEASKAFLKAVEADVIVTHHAPSAKSIAEKYRGEQHAAMNRAYYSDMDDVVEQSGAKLWVHGHMHTATDYMIGGTRVVLNPRGYPGEATGFDPALLVEV